jgi:hypothetical protein
MSVPSNPNGGLPAALTKPNGQLGRDQRGRFLTGNTGGGRPKGSRNKLGEEFVNALYDDWRQHGAEALARVREQRPDAYVRIVAALLPASGRGRVRHDGRFF